MKLQLLLHATSVLALQAPRGPLRGPQRQTTTRPAMPPAVVAEALAKGPLGVPALAAVAGAVLAGVVLRARFLVGLDFVRGGELLELGRQPLALRIADVGRDLVRVVF